MDPVNPCAAPPRTLSGVKVSVGFSSRTGPRERNEDFVGVVFGPELPTPRADVVAALADGIGGAKGGRVAAEIAVRGFLDGFFDLPDTLEVRRAAATIVTSLNRWIHSMGRHDPNLAGMGCTLTAAVFRGRSVHILHVGDSRLYRLRDGRLLCLTKDHARRDASGRMALYRALGVEEEAVLDYSTQPLALHDRFLLCSDGVHGFLSSETLADILRELSAPEDSARAIVAAALGSGGGDNSTALVLDVVEIPNAGSAYLGAAEFRLPMIAEPSVGQSIDGFALRALISEGRFTRLFSAQDRDEGGDVALKFPKPNSAPEDAVRMSFVREAWVGTRVNSPWVGRVIEPAPGRQSCLYTVMPLHQGELLETRLARSPSIGLEEGRAIGVRLARAAAALHRLGVVHRDIKPDNVILESAGSLKLVDLGAVRVPGLEDAEPEAIPGTFAYMAPEMTAGEERGDAATDVYALGVTLYRAFAGVFPYGNADAASPPRRDRPKDLCALRPDLPAWLQATIAKAISLDRGLRFRDMNEFAQELEAGPANRAIVSSRPLTLYERHPLRVWQAVALFFALAFLLSLLRR